MQNYAHNYILVTFICMNKLCQVMSFIRVMAALDPVEIIIQNVTDVKVYNM